MMTRWADGAGRIAWVLWAAFGAACTASEGDTGPVTLPPLETGTPREDSGTFPFDTSADTAPTDESPPHTLTLSQAGTWTLGGASGDPSSMTGTLVVTELLDGDTEAPACLETWALVGTRAATDCDGCAYTFAVEHTRVTTEGACRTPELPETGDVRALGYSAAEGRIWWDWYDTGVWVPLWDAERGESADELVFSWETELGVTGEEEE